MREAFERASVVFEGSFERALVVETAEAAVPPGRHGREGSGRRGAFLTVRLLAGAAEELREGMLRVALERARSETT